jgi:threonine/homoserine/homoserine lactone efflux protein
VLVPPGIVYFVPAALVVLLVPGPAVIYISTKSLAEGKRAGLVSVLGVQLADLTHALFAAAGLSAILLTSSLAFDAVKFLGAGYLIYLGLRSILSREGGSTAQSFLPVRTKPSRVFANGFLVDLLNPKTALFFYAFLPQFVGPPAGAAAAEQILFLGIVFVLLGLCTDSSYALFGSLVRNLLSKTSRFRKSGKYVTGGIYLAIGVIAATVNSKE